MKNETIATEPTVMLHNGNLFPCFEGKPLSWSIGLYFTHAERVAGFHRAKSVILAMREHRPAELEAERRQLVKDSLNSVFGHNAEEQLRLIESEGKL